ncbi:MAG TPA: DUF817 family protein [Fimbriimonadaceae bacterium]|nr:DUF817 family protein [Fimbriimonadaceae bacterium]
MWKLPRASEWPRFLVDFFRLQVVACTFAFSLVFLIAVTRYVGFPWLPRYDWLFLFCLAIQFLMVRAGFETWRDAAVVGVFHVLGTGLELYKVSQGSWSYPGDAHFAVGPVPLFAGFMYGSVASYMGVAWKKMSLRANGWPDPIVTLSFALLIYSQFFFHAWPVVVRLLMLALTVFVFRKSSVHFDCSGGRWSLPMPVAFVLIGTMIYAAENIGTFFRGWMYPYQAIEWTPVHPMKLVAWILLMTVSLIVVAEYKRRIAELAPSLSQAQEQQA